jgi:RimJ/RimL family protein N-acetyltransferase
VIETERLRLRPWRETDRPAWREMMADPEVADWLGGVRSPADNDAAFNRWREGIAANGYGMWAAERRTDGVVIGSVGVRRILEVWNHPFSGEVEVGWRLARNAWGAGYASEGAAAALAWGFAKLALDRIVAFTAHSNARSEAVMRRIGMRRRPDLDFDHPNLAPDHALRQHIVYVAERALRRATPTTS